MRARRVSWLSSIHGRYLRAKREPGAAVAAVASRVRRNDASRPVWPTAVTQKERETVGNDGWRVEARVPTAPACRSLTALRRFCVIAVLPPTRVIWLRQPREQD